MDKAILEHATTQVRDHDEVESAPGKRIHCLLWVAMGISGAAAMIAQASLELSALAAPAPVARLAPAAPGAHPVRLPAAMPAPGTGVSSRAGRPDKYGPAAYLATTTKEMK